MGRHSTPDVVPEQPPARRRAAGVVLWLERVGLGLAAGAGTLLVLRWAGTSWTASAWIAGAVTVVVPVAAWLASTVPGHEGPRHDEPGEA